MRGGSLFGSFSAVTLLAASAIAQTAPPGTAPPPPASTAQPPPPSPRPPAYRGYPPPGAYPGYLQPEAYPPPAPRKRPKELAYHEGMTIPQGYHLETGMRKGLVVAGTVVIGVPYFIGLVTAGGYSFSNSSGWLAVPVAGPWITLAARNSPTCGGQTCGDDVAPLIFLGLDSGLQTIGAALLIWGIADKKEYLLRDDVVRIIDVAPTRIGSGYGVALLGSF